MTKVTMPEPVAWVRRHPDGALTAEFLEDAVIDPARKRSGAWLPLITTAQAEAYKDACVKAALEEALMLLETRQFGGQDQIIRCIRALIPTK